jgi:branched-chain amino acid transport system ATP-binding protein
MESSLLTIKNLWAGYRDIPILTNISLHINKGETITLIGSNGAGKTTLLNVISGIIKSQKGQIYFAGNEIHKLPPHRIVRLGISHVPEGRQIFSPMTVYDNILLGAFSRNDKDKKSLKNDLDFIFDLFPILYERKNQIAGTLSGGEQQMLAIARAFMSKPALLLLDEPSLGLAPKIVELIMQTITLLNKNGLTILLVEQNAKKALNISHRGYVLDTGKIVLQGESSYLIDDPDVQRAYLGKDYQSISER